ncbi:MAG: division/cell wall cluster transcriptional repressor MraZ [Caldilineales bacterium]
MLIGQYEHTLDNKGRLTLPSEYGELLADGIVLTRGLESCLYIFTRAGFEQLSQQMDELSLTDVRARQLRRLFFSQASAALPDKQRRIVIPQWLREAANISEKVMIAGLNSYIELWEPTAWRAQQESARHEMQDTNYFTDLGVRVGASR